MKNYVMQYRFTFSEGYKWFNVPQEFIKYQKGLLTIVAAASPQKDGGWYRGKGYELKLYSPVNGLDVRINSFDKLRDAVKAADAIRSELDLLEFINKLTIEDIENRVFFYYPENYQKFSRIGALSGKHMPEQKAA